ncbi:hypothetical protein F0562_015490 [Nyssa sinensis]|uniref:Uncharacterized protein n=1 Tax=Nyssa sinensis TaxID=561372 RepID=A0A5J4ZJ02_9ASTE|nr:hypothetical protein F0562_015490 [Nyssa sinensis]
MVEAFPWKRRPPSSTPKPPRKKNKAKRAEVLLETVVLMAEGTQVVKAIPSGSYVPKMVLSKPQARTMIEDEDTLHNLRRDILKTLGLLEEITKPSVTIDINLVEELDTTLEVDQKLGRFSFTQDAPDKKEHVYAREEFIQDGRVGLTTSDTEAGPSQASPSCMHDLDPFAPFVHKVHESKTVEVLEFDGLAVSWLRYHLVHLGHVRRQIVWFGEPHQLESKHAKLYKQVTSFVGMIVELKASRNAGGVKLGLGEEGLRRSTLLDLV